MKELLGLNKTKTIKNIVGAQSLEPLIKMCVDPQYEAMKTFWFRRKP